jgi:pyrroloquinoline quinone biosynthesis protein B
MRVTVLGSAAGGGSPQWNCACSVCTFVRQGRVAHRTQDSVALIGKSGVALLNASPDVLRQIERTPALQPTGARTSPIRAIVLTNGDLDHVLGLFSLRESTPLAIYATRSLWEAMERDVAFVRSLRRFEGHTTFRPLTLGETVTLPEIDERFPPELTPFAVPGKLPVHRMGKDVPSPEDNVGLHLRHPESGHALVYVPGAGGPGEWVKELERSDLLFLDGTFWSSTELIDAGLSKARAEDMAHWPVGGPEGSIATLSDRKLPFRRFFTHVNNTNRMLLPDSEERKYALSAGWGVAHDDMTEEL